MKLCTTLLSAAIFALAGGQTIFAQFEELSGELDNAPAFTDPQDPGLPGQDPEFLPEDPGVPVADPGVPVIEPEFPADEPIVDDPNIPVEVNSAALNRGNAPIQIGRFKNSRHGIQFESTGGLTRGLKILAVDKVGLARTNGIEAGDVILNFNGRSISSPADLENATRAVPSSVAWVPLTVLDVRTGQAHSMRYQMLTNAGSYQSNFGRLELVQMPSQNAGVSVLEGTLFFYDGKTSQVRGTIAGSTFVGTSTFPGRSPAPFELEKVGGVFEGFVTQGRQMRFIMVRRN